MVDVLSSSLGKEQYGVRLLRRLISSEKEKEECTLTAQA